MTTPADPMTALLDQLINEQGVDQLTASQMIWAPHLTRTLHRPTTPRPRPEPEPLPAVDQAQPKHHATKTPPIATDTPTAPTGGTMFDRLFTWLLGPRCPFGCGQRLYPKDQACHFAVDHAGETGSQS